MSSMDSIETLSPKAAKILGLPMHKSLDTTVIGHRIPIRSLMKEELEYRSRGAETAILYKDDKPILQAGIPYEQQTKGTADRSKSSRTIFEDKSPPRPMQEGFFTSMARQQRKNAFVNFTSFRVAKKTSSASTPIQRASTQKLATRRSQRSLRDAKQAQLPRLVTASTVGFQAQRNHESPVDLPSSSSMSRSVTGPAPSLMADSDSRSRSSSGSGSPSSSNSEKLKQLRGRRARNPDFTHSKDLSSYFGLPAPMDFTPTRRETGQEPTNIQQWFENLSLSDEHAQYTTPYSHSIFSEYMTTSNGQQSVELTALGDDFDIRSQDPSEFRAFFLPTPIRNYFELDAEDTSRSPTSSSPTKPSGPSERIDETQDIIIDGTSVLDLSYDDEEKDSNADNAMFLADEYADHTRRAGSASSVDPRMEYVHPLLREALIADQAIDSTELNDNAFSVQNRVRRNSGLSTTSTVYDPEQKFLPKTFSDSEEYNTATVTTDAASKGKSERLIAVSEEEERILAMMRRQRSSAQQHKTAVLGQPENTGTIGSIQRRSKSEDQTTYRHGLENVLNLPKLRRSLSQENLKAESSHQNYVELEAIPSAKAQSLKTSTSPKTIEGALDFDPLTRAKSSSSRPVKPRSKKSQKMRDALNKPLPAPPLALDAESIMSISTPSSSRAPTPPLPTKSTRRTFSQSTRGAPGQWQMTPKHESFVVSPLSVATNKDTSAFFPQLQCKPYGDSYGEVRIASLMSPVGGSDTQEWNDTWV